MFWILILGTFILSVMIFSANFMIRKSVDSNPLNYSEMNKVYDEIDQEVFNTEDAENMDVPLSLEIPHEGRA